MNMQRIPRSRFLQLFLMLLAGLLLGWVFFRDSGGHRHGENGAGGGTTGSVKEAAIYTCSMHPQIRQEGPGQCPICGMDLVPVAPQGGDNGPSGPYILSMSPEAAALSNVQTIRVENAPPEHEISLSGKIAVNERNLAAITANFSGRIEKLYIDFTGQEVKKGQKLATLYSPELITAQKELLEAARGKAANPVLYNAVREKLRLWKITDGQIADIETAGEITPHVDIFSEVSGTVLNRGFATGDFISKGSVLFEIADLSRVWVLLDAYESDLAWVRVGEKLKFTVASLPGREFSSTVAFVDPLVNPGTRTAAVRAEVANPGLVLKPDMFVKATVNAKAAAREKSLRIPKSAVLWTGERSVVYVDVSADDNPAFEMREITLGARSGDHYIAASGLRPGEKVVVNGVFAIDAAAQLSGKYSMMNRPPHLGNRDSGADHSTHGRAVNPPGEKPPANAQHSH